MSDDARTTSDSKAPEVAGAVAGAGSGAGAGAAAGGDSTTGTRKAWRMETPPEFQRSPDEVRHALAEFSVYLSERTRHHLGYPYNLKFDTGALSPFLQYSINNLGDPFVESNYGVHSRKFEIEVLNFFADLWRIPRDEYWGYTTTCGTEGNLLGVLYGREKLPDATLFCSRDTHYSVPKAAMMYRIPLVFVDSQETGEVDYADLLAKLKAHNGGQAIVTFNAGTTVKGAVDCVDTVIETIHAAGISRENFYVHCDGALAGLIIPFVENCDTRYEVSFEKEIDSVSVSGHKMLGCPMPCGVVLTRKEHMEKFKRDVEYLNSRDTTIMGSRNGQAPVAMWYALQVKGVEGMRADVEDCIENAKFLTKLFSDAGVKAHLNKLSTTVVFERPSSEEVVSRWQLACAGDIAHVVVMPSATRGKLKEFFRDYMAARKTAAAAAAATADE
mgnify:CR=1 FL=1